jgi:hypothetical protein
MLNLWILGAFLLGYALSAVISRGGPVSLAMAQQRAFWVGWKARKKYPANALPRTRAEVNRLLAEDAKHLGAL